MQKLPKRLDHSPGGCAWGELDFSSTAVHTHTPSNLFIISNSFTLGLFRSGIGQVQMFTSCFALLRMLTALCVYQRRTHTSVVRPTVEKWRHFILIFHTFCTITPHTAKSSTRGHHAPSRCYISNVKTQSHASWWQGR